MAGCEDEFSLINQLNSIEIPITINLAEALVADEVEKFLKLYDNIPKSFSTERVDYIKEMARQLAALPKKQFDMYRTKARGFLSSDYFSPPNIQVSVEKLSQTPLVNGGTMDSNLLEKSALLLEDIEILEKVTEKPSENSENTSKSSNKKKKKSKKQKSKMSAGKNKKDEVIENVNLGQCEMEKEKESCVMEQKLLDADGTRTATMNRQLVADISTGPSGIFKSRTSTASIVDNNEPKGSGKQQSDESGKEEIHGPSGGSYLSDQPPFGFPLSTDKLISSAVGLLSHDTLQCVDSSPPASTITTPSSDINNVSSDINNGKNISKEEFQTVDASGKHSKAENLDTYNGERDSGDGDVSSALEDEGWQSQSRRSHRKKKKELAVRSSQEKTKVEQKQGRNTQSSHLKNNTKRPHGKKLNGNLDNSSRSLNEVTNTDDKRERARLSKNSEDLAVSVSTDSATGSIGVAEDQSGENLSDPLTSSDSKAPFSYRDALLKLKPNKLKVSDELHYSSDSGVDANSVSSCDSGIPSPELPPQELYNFKQSVSFLLNGWNEVMDLKKKGQVTYYNNEMEFPGKRRPRKGGYKPRNNDYHKQRSKNTVTPAAR